jgi:Predicted permease
MATRTAALESAIAGGEAASHWRTRTVALVLLMAIGAYFWTVSRYPALYKKYSQGTQVKVTGAITFGTVLPVSAGMSLGQRVWRTSINWLQANEIGMTFGFFFGAAALTVLATIPRRRTRNAYVNSLLGAAVGMPLGVCANCVAPIGRGLYESGMSTESTLAAMFSSPTLNVVVLAMAFTLFPLPVVGLKLATMLVMILVFAPLIARWKVGPITAGECAVEIPASATWGQAITATAKSYAKSFWHVARVGVPLMVLAAVLGALAVETIPQTGLHAPATLGGIALVAIVLVFGSGENDFLEDCGIGWLRGCGVGDDCGSCGDGVGVTSLKARKDRTGMSACATSGGSPSCGVCQSLPPSGRLCRCGNTCWG